MNHLDRECAELLRALISDHAFLQPDNDRFGFPDKGDLEKVGADLFSAIKNSFFIKQAHSLDEWGK